MPSKETAMKITASNARPTNTGTDRGIDVSIRVEGPGALDAMGVVTLLPAEDGRPVYTSWGEPEMWVSGAMLGTLRVVAEGAAAGLRDMLDEIEAAAAVEAGRPPGR